MQRFFRFLLALTLSSVALPALADDAAENFFVLIYTQGPTWQPGVPMAKQKFGNHLGYMKSLRDAHKLFVAGPLADTNGGLIVLRAKNIDEARDIMAHDPAIQSGLFTGQAHTWQDAVDSGKTAADFLAAPE
ncbi:MAG TPA: YciI family protein [Rhizomicrobium sp.]